MAGNPNPNCVQKEGKGLRETVRLYNLPVESLIEDE